MTNGRSRPAEMAAKERKEHKEGEEELALEPSESLCSLRSFAANPDLGFKVFKLAESNFAIWNPALAATEPVALAKQWQLTTDNVRADASETALLYELMLEASPKDWLPLQMPPVSVDVAGARAWLLGGDRLLLCLARDITREQLRAMTDLQPQAVLCLDVAFKGNDALKVNATSNFKATESSSRPPDTMPDENPSSSEIIHYQTEDGQTRVECRFESETFWHSQKQIAELFQKDVRTINEHIQNGVEEGELTPDSVVRKFRITAADGKTYETQHYHPDVIISVGYRVKSVRGTPFRIWATRRLRDLRALADKVAKARPKRGKAGKQPRRNAENTKMNLHEGICYFFALLVFFCGNCLL